MAYPRDLSFETVRSVARAAITANYQVLGGTISSPARLIKIVNDTDVLLQISTDSTNLHDVYPPYSGTVYDVTTNKVRDDGFFVKAGDQFYVQHAGVAPTAGTGVYLVVITGG